MNIKSRKLTKVDKLLRKRKGFAVEETRGGSGRLIRKNPMTSFNANDIEFLQNLAKYYNTRIRFFGTVGIYRRKHS